VSENDESSARSKRDRGRKRLKRGTSGEVWNGSKRKGVDSYDSSSAHHREKRKSKDRKHVRSSRERFEGTERAKKKSARRVRSMPRYPTLDDNLQRVAEMEGSSSISAIIPEPDDISLVVMKHTHSRKAKQGKSKKKGKGKKQGGSGRTHEAAPQLILSLQ
jgi:hypothetical protein